MPLAFRPEKSQATSTLTLELGDFETYVGGPKQAAEWSQVRVQPQIQKYLLRIRVTGHWAPNIFLTMCPC